MNELNPRLKKFAKEGRFLMAALDHRGSLVRLINRKERIEAKEEDFINWKAEVLEVLTPKASAVLLDVKIGLRAYKKVGGGKPYLLAIEKSGYDNAGGERLTRLAYSAEDLKKRGAGGVKLLLYYNPGGMSAKAQEETVKRVSKQCEQANLPFLLEIVTYNLPGKRRRKSNLVLDSVERFLSLGVKVDIYKLEFPGGVETAGARRVAGIYCLKITERLRDIPWILLSAGGKFQVFLKQVEIASKSGAKGFLAGRALWQDWPGRDKKAREVFLKKEVVDRFNKIKRATD